MVDSMWIRKDVWEREMGMKDMVIEMMDRQNRELMGLLQGVLYGPETQPVSNANHLAPAPYIEDEADPRQDATSPVRVAVPAWEAAPWLTDDDDSTDPSREFRVVNINDLRNEDNG